MHPPALPLNRTVSFPTDGYALRKQIGYGVVGALGIFALVRPAALSPLFSANYLPHRYCYLAKPGLVWTNAVADGLIAVSYALLFGCLFWLAAKVRHASVLHPYPSIFIGFGLFIFTCLQMDVNVMKVLKLSALQMFSRRNN